jgi:SAM-dependent methyltransferase
MYERLSPMYRQVMTDTQLISTIKYVASTRPEFLLSEIANYLDEPQTVSRMYIAIQPHLRQLGLLATKVGGDYELSRIVPAKPYTLNTEEEKRIAAFFEGGMIPPALLLAIEQYITKKVGKRWDDPVILSRLRRAIVAQKDDYWKPTHKRSLQYSKGYHILGYLAYHFPVYFMQTQHLLALLARDGLLKDTMTILDAGTGPGVVPLAIADFYSRLDTARATIHAVERSEEHCEAFTFLTEHVAHTNPRVTIKPPVKADITALEPGQIPDSIDLAVFSNVINEMTGASVEARADLVMGIADRLAPDGTILIVEPAEEVTSTGLRTLSLAVKKRGLSIYAPCTFIHTTNCTPDRCWSFVTAKPIRPTPIMNALAACDEPFRYVNTDIKYSYLILRKDGKTRETYRVPAGTRGFRLSGIHLHVGRRVNLVAAKMSEDLGDTQTLLFRLCDGSAEKPVYAVLPAFHITTENDPILSAPYGSILRLENALVRYNKAHDAYNVLVNRQTRVAVVGGSRLDEDRLIGDCDNNRSSFRYRS